MYTSNTSNTFSDVDHRKTTAHLNQGKNMALTGRDVRVYFFKSSGWSADTFLTYCFLVETESRLQHLF